MIEDLNKINDWVEVEPLDLFSELSGSGDEVLMSLSDRDAKAACKGIRRGRAQYVVDAAYSSLVQRGESVGEERSRIEAEIQALDAGYLDDRAKLVKRLEEAGRVIALISQTVGTIDAPNTQPTSGLKERMSSNAQRLVDLIESGGTPDTHDVISLFENLGPFEVSFLATADGKDMSLGAWLDKYKEETDYTRGLDRGKKIVAMERAANRFLIQKGFSRSNGNGFTFIMNLPQNVVTIDTLKLDEREIISSFTVLEPVHFLNEVLKNENEGGLDKVGIKAILGLRLIAEIQKA